MTTSGEQPVRAGFWQQRTGWRLLKQVLFLEPLPGGARWASAFGSLLLVVFAVQVVTGVLLTMNYAPTVESAWPSVNFIQEDVPLGGFVRALHHWGSSVLVILLLVHLVQVFVWGAYKKPRELTWMVGVLLLVCILGLAFTGYLLPWDQKAYWATRVGLGIVSTTPVIGDDLRALLQGGSAMGNLTLTRFFTLHAFVLPGLVIFLVVVHLYLFRLHGVTPPWWESAAQLKAKEEPFWPRQLLKDGVLWLVLLVGLGLWAYYQPAPLETQADPSQPYEARPEWYFMFLFQLLRYFQGPYEVVGTFVLPLLLVVVLLCWPFLDRSPHRDPRRRPVAIGFLALGTCGLIGWTVVAIVTDVRMTEPVQAKAALAEPADPLQRTEVAKVYNRNCAACHEVDGRGQQIRAGLPTLPDFTSLAWQKSQTNIEIVHRILDGNEPLMPAYRDKLSEQEILALAVYVRAFSATAAEPAGRKPTPVVRTPVASHMPPAAVYRTYCLICHDPDGSGQKLRRAMPDLPDFTKPSWQDAHRDAALLKSILDGKGKLMPAMKTKLNEEEATKMVALVRQFRGGQRAVNVQLEPLVAPAPPDQPKVVSKLPPAKPLPTRTLPDTAAKVRIAAGLYRQNCLVCHGADGRGSDLKSGMPTLPDFSSRAWQAAASNHQLLANILEGKGTLMPAFAGRIRNDQAKDLVAYVRSFGPMPATPVQAPDGDFEQQFFQLQQEWNELHRQLRELPKSSPKQ